MGSLSFNSKTGSSFIWVDKHRNYKLIQLWTSSLHALKLHLKVTVGQGEKRGALTLDCQHPAISKLAKAPSIFTASIYHCCNTAQMPATKEHASAAAPGRERNNPTFLLLLSAGCTRQHWGKVRQAVLKPELPCSRVGWTCGGSGGCPGSRPQGR